MKSTKSAKCACCWKLTKKSSPAEWSIPVTKAAWAKRLAVRKGTVVDLCTKCSDKVE